MSRGLAAGALHDDLLARAQADAIAALGPAEAFIAKTIKGRRYWYVQEPAATGRRQRYVGPETPELLARIAAARGRAEDLAERARLVRALRAAGLPGPAPLVGRLLAVLAEAGVFRLRGVLVGTHAFNCYPGLLQVLLPGTLGVTADADLAQDPAVSIAVGDALDAPLKAVLHRVDPRFVAVPGIDARDPPTRWRAPGIEVELLAVNRGRPAARLVPPALRASGTALRLLDFLLHEPLPAVALHGAGVLVSVPEPARYAVHELLLAERRGAAGAGKARKDIAQAAALIPVLAEDRPHDLAAAWAEARARGPSWRHALQAGAAALPEAVRRALPRDAASAP